MNQYKDQAIQDIICADFQNMSRQKIESMTFQNSNEHYDYEKITCEGSTWIVYWYDVMRDYYQQNKKRIDKMVSRALSY